MRLAHEFHCTHIRSGQRELVKSKSCQMTKATDHVEREEAKGLHVTAGLQLLAQPSDTVAVCSQEVQAEVPRFSLLSVISASMPPTSILGQKQVILGFFSTSKTCESPV